MLTTSEWQGLNCEVGAGERSAVNPCNGWDVASTTNKIRRADEQNIMRGEGPWRSSRTLKIFQ